MAPWGFHYATMCSYGKAVWNVRHKHGPCHVERSETSQFMKVRGNSVEE